MKFQTLFLAAALMLSGSFALAAQEATEKAACCAPAARGGQTHDHGSGAGCCGEKSGATDCCKDMKDGQSCCKDGTMDCCKDMKGTPDGQACCAGTNKDAKDGKAACCQK